MLPFQVPLLVAVAEFLWQLGMLEDKELFNIGRGTIFLDYTSAHYFFSRNLGIEY